jgi:antitoxin CptB
MSAVAEARLRRLRMRCWRRGTREMDLLMGPFADAALPALDAARLEDLERLLSENDQELFHWISGQCSIPLEHEEMVSRIRAYHRIG